MTNRGRVLKAIDPRVEPALKVLARDGLPSPAVLELGTLVVCGVPRPDLTRFELEEDGSLTLKIKRSALRIRDVDPSAWSPTDVAATLAGGEELILDQGAVHISGRHFSVDGSSPNLTDARIDGWAWHVDAPPGTAVLWAARVRFTSLKPPIVLWWPDGNLRFRVGDDVVRGWRFQTPNGSTFLVLRDEQWFVAFESSTPPDQLWVMSVMNAVGFVVGEPLNIGVLHAVGTSSVGIGKVRYMLVPWASRQGCEAPAVPVQAGAAAIVAFIEGIVQFDANDQRARCLSRSTTTLNRSTEPSKRSSYAGGSPLRQSRNGPARVAGFGRSRSSASPIMTPGCDGCAHTKTRSRDSRYRARARACSTE
jgi:hypothetical protein